MHSGGYILGDPEAEDMICRTISKEANTIIISVDYRLTPKHKHPAQLKDTLVVIEWVRASKLINTITR
jgi:acetyl esterase/lipase